MAGFAGVHAKAAQGRRRDVRAACQILPAGSGKVQHTGHGFNDFIDLKARACQVLHTGRGLGRGERGGSAQVLGGLAELCKLLIRSTGNGGHSAHTGVEIRGHLDRSRPKGSYAGGHRHEGRSNAGDFIPYIF